MKSCVKEKLETLIDKNGIPYCDSMKEISEFLMNNKKMTNKDYQMTSLINDVDETECQQRKLSCYENV